ncbi:MAG: DUF222 domain-containing protein [Canibacter sp.]
MSDRYRRSRVMFEPVDAAPLQHHNENGNLVNLVRGFQDSFSKAFPDLSEAPESELPDLIRELGKLKNLVEATTTHALAQVQRFEQAGSSVSRRHGAKNPEELYMTLTGEGWADAKRRSKLAALEFSQRDEPDQPGELARTAYREGRIAGSVYQLITDSLAKVPEAQRFSAERRWMKTADPDNALKPSFGGLRKIIATTLAEYTVTVDRDHQEEMQKRRALTLHSDENGLVRVSGQLLPEVAAVFGRCLDVINTPVHTKLDGESTEVEDPRTPQQKNHDALATIVNVALGSKAMPAPGGKPAVVLIHTTEDRLLHQDGASVLAGHDGCPTIIPSAEARTSGCAGATQRLILGRDGRIVQLEHERRTFNADQRRAMAARDGGCVIPGCTVPPGWCEAHHIETWANTKRTHVATGALLCWFHHRSVDSDGWGVRTRDGLIEVQPPTREDWHPAASGPRLTRRDPL